MVLACSPCPHLGTHMTIASVLGDLPLSVTTPIGDLKKHQTDDYYFFEPLPELKDLFELLACLSGIEGVDILTPHFENHLDGSGGVQKAPFMEPVSDGGKTSYRAYDEVPDGYVVLSDLCGKDGTVFVGPQDTFNSVSSLPEELTQVLHQMLAPTQFGFGTQVGPIRPVAFEWPDEGGKFLADVKPDTPLVVLGRLRFAHGQWIGISGCPYGSNCGQSD